MHIIEKVSTFDKLLSKTLSTEQINQFYKLLARLCESPWIGDSLGPVWFRELKIGSKRIYYVVGNVILLVSVSNKNTQRAILHSLRKNLALYKSLAR